MNNMTDDTNCTWPEQGLVLVPKDDLLLNGMLRILGRCEGEDRPGVLSAREQKIAHEHKLNAMLLHSLRDEGRKKYLTCEVS